MNININIGGKRIPDPKFIPAAAILQFLINDDNELTKELILGATKKHYITTDKEVYEALSCVKKYDDFKLNKLVKLLERVDVYSYAQQTQRNKTLVTFERIEQLRKLALQGDNHD